MNSSLNSAIVRPIALTAVILMTVLGGIIFYQQNELFVTRLKLRAEMVANVVGNAASVVSREEELDRVIERLSKESGVMQVVLVGGTPPRVLGSTETAWRGKTLAQLPEAEVSEDIAEAIKTGEPRFHRHHASKLLDYTMPFRARMPCLGGKAEELGIVMVHLDYRVVEQAMHRSVLVMAAGGGVAMVVLVGLMVGLLHRQVLRPLHDMGIAAEWRGKGDLGRRVQEVGGAEIVALARSLNAAFDAVDRGHEALRRSEQFTRTLLDLMPAMIWVKNADGTYAMANQARAAFLGGTPDELVGGEDASKGTEQRDKEFWGSSEETMVQEEMVTGEDGVERWFLTTRKKLTSATGATQLLCLASEITERKLAEERILETLKEVSDLRLALDASSIVAVTDPRGIITSANERFAEISGYRQVELIGQDHRILNSGCHPKEFMREMWATIGRGKIWRGEVCNRAKNGQVYWVDSTIVPFLDEVGKPVQYVSIRHDITARKRAEAELIRSTALQRAIIDNAQHVILSTDTEGCLKMFNPAAERLLGYVGTEVVGRETMERFLDSRELEMRMEETMRMEGVGMGERARFEFLVAKTRRGEVNEDEWTFVHRDGSRIPMWMILTGLKGVDGELAGFIVIASDISRRKKAEAELARVNREMVDLSRLAGMSEVASSVLHNVGNVLNSVNVSAQVIFGVLQKSRAPGLMKAVAMMEEQGGRLGEYLASDPKGSRIPQYLVQAAREVAADNDRLGSELGGLQKSIDHIKEVIAMQQGYARVGGISEDLDPRSLVDDAIRLNRDSMERHKIRIVREFAEAPMVRTDKHKVLQILVNLIRNAKHACEDSNEADPCIRFRVGGEGDWVAIEVLDNGVGISAENLARIFQHGFTTKKQGHGFGLHSGILAAKELGGKLVALSEGIGKGARFRLELPITPPLRRVGRSA